MPVLLAGLSCLAGWTVAGCGEPTLSFDDYIEAGRERYDDGRYAAALAMFDGAAEQNRDRAEPAFHKGRCHLAMARKRFEGGHLIGALRESDRAIACFDDAIGVFPGFGLAVQGKADALKLSGKHAAAMEIADWAAEHSGAHVRKLILKARIHAQAGEMDQAQLALKQATSVEPDDAAAHAQLGLFYLQCGNEPAAVGSLKRAYALNPGAPGVVSALAQLGALSDVPVQD